MKIGAISESLEDYIEIIHTLCFKNRVARVKDIADHKNVNMSSVVPALKRLQKEGLIDYESRGFVTLTPRGAELASSVISRHEFVKFFLTRILDVPPDIAEKDACSFEHHMSPETFRKLVAFFEFVEGCGANIHEKFQEFYQNTAASHQPLCGKRGCQLGHKEFRFGHHWDRIRTLSDLKPGQTGRVKRILAANSIRQRLIDMGLLPNVEVSLERIAPLGDPIEIKLRGYHLTLRKEEADSILIDDANDV